MAAEGLARYAERQAKEIARGGTVDEAEPPKHHTPRREFYDTSKMRSMHVLQ